MIFLFPRWDMLIAWRVYMYTYISPQIKNDIVTCAQAPPPRGHAEHGVSTKPPAQLPGVPPGQAAELPQRKTWISGNVGGSNPENQGLQ